jgi:hypothetical protein
MNIRPVSLRPALDRPALLVCPHRSRSLEADGPLTHACTSRASLARHGDCSTIGQGFSPERSPVRRCP